MIETMWIFQPAKLHQKKFEETTWIFWPSKRHQKKYVEITWIFWPSKLRRKRYVETMWIFRSAKLHWKSTWKWRWNSSKFGLHRIDVGSTWCARYVTPAQRRLEDTRMFSKKECRYMIIEATFMKYVKKPGAMTRFTLKPKVVENWT